MGKLLLVFGVVIAGVGLFLMFFDKVPFLGKLPGDISIKRENLQFHFPITTSALLSIVASLLFWLFQQFKGK